MPQGTTIFFLRAEPIAAGGQRGHTWSLKYRLKLTTHVSSVTTGKQIQH